MPHRRHIKPDGPGIVRLTQPASQKHPYIHEAMARRILCLDLIGEPRAYISTCPTRSRKTNSANCSVPLHAGGACQGIPSTPLAPGGTGRTTISLGSGSRRYLQIRSVAQDGMPRTPSGYYWLRRLSSRRPTWTRTGQREGGEVGVGTKIQVTGMRRWVGVATHCSCERMECGDRSI